MSNFWQDLPKPILALAPMEDVTDTVFRQIVASCARPDIFFTEFTSVEGMQSQGRNAVIHRLKFTEVERPIVAQIWGIRPENFYKTARELVAMGFDGIDINMGCPIKDIIKNGACAGLMKNPSLAKEIIMAVREGAGTLPISVKTRIGFKTIKTEEWISHLLTCGIDALTIHGRTAAELSKAPTHWDEIAKAVSIRDSMNVNTVILGNGDVVHAADAIEKCKRYGTDGAMIGRGVFDNPWAFDRVSWNVARSPKELLDLMRKHVELFEKTWGKQKHFAILKKFFKIYIRGFDGASELRVRVMNTTSPDEVLRMIQ